MINPAGSRQARMRWLFETLHDIDGVALVHSDNEYVSIDDYLTSIKVLTLSIYHWCKTEKQV